MTETNIIRRDGRTLMHDATGQPVMVGELLTDFRGDTAVAVDAYAPTAPGKAGYVVVREPGLDGESMFYVTVFDLHWANA